MNEDCSLINAQILMVSKSHTLLRSRFLYPTRYRVTIRQIIMIFYQKKKRQIIMISWDFRLIRGKTREEKKKRALIGFLRLVKSSIYSSAIYICKCKKGQKRKRD